MAAIVPLPALPLVPQPEQHKDPSKDEYKGDVNVEYQLQGDVLVIFGVFIVENLMRKEMNEYEKSRIT